MDEEDLDFDSDEEDDVHDVNHPLFLMALRGEMEPLLAAVDLSPDLLIARLEDDTASSKDKCAFQGATLFLAACGGRKFKSGQSSSTERI